MCWYVLKKLYTMDFLKTNRLRFTEFFNGLKLIKDALNKIHEGNDSYFMVLSSQLRAMFILPHDQNGLVKKEDSLIGYYLAKELGVDLGVFISDKECEKKDCQYYEYLFHTTLHQTDENKRQISLVDWLEKDIVSIPGKTFKIWEIIKIMADKNGGAHYDHKMNKKELVQLCEARNNKGVVIINLLLERIANVLYKVGLKIIKSFLDFQLALSLVLFKDILPKKNIVSFAYNQTYVPVSIFIGEQNSLKLKISGDKQCYVFDIYDLSNIKEDRVLVINIAYQITEDMKAILIIYCNETYMEIELSTPLLIGNNFMINSNMVLSDVDLSLGFSSMKLFRTILDEGKNISLNQQLRKIEGNILVASGKKTAKILEDFSMNFTDDVCYESYKELVKK